ncbi:hypothetical protein SCLCIDRAFT_1208468 [Scleroderma citrinum Foug A]|uniref:Uncharacterized protein n=1 Tax=Scleroderma citrinum Foug A TaxID=1036808 RepID=A0A0C3AVR6_9AGAM|nr:hypothetical protein SCLCIDRAFT_1208468 [Scleroderma citrinum Foug A]
MLSEKSLCPGCQQRDRNVAALEHCTKSTLRPGAQATGGSVQVTLALDLGHEGPATVVYFFPSRNAYRLGNTLRQCIRNCGTIKERGVIYIKSHAL